MGPIKVLQGKCGLNHWSIFRFLSMYVLLSFFPYLVNLRRLKNITTECFEGAKEIGAGTVIGHKPTSKATQG